MVWIITKSVKISINALPYSKVCNALRYHDLFTGQVKVVKCELSATVTLFPANWRVFVQIPRWRDGGGVSRHLCIDCVCMAPTLHRNAVLH